MASTFFHVLRDEELRVGHRVLADDSNDWQCLSGRLHRRQHHRGAAHRSAAEEGARDALASQGEADGREHVVLLVDAVGEALAGAVGDAVLAEVEEKTGHAERLKERKLREKEKRMRKERKKK